MLAAAALFAADAVVFRSGWYKSLLEPDSSVAMMERMIEAERGRQSQPARHQVLALGDSRMGFFVRFANESDRGAGVRFATLSLGGQLPRQWPYILRAVDPKANHYSAILLPLDDYDDLDTGQIMAERVSDLRYLGGQLRLSDLPDFAGSFLTWSSRWQAARSILFNGFAFQKDVQAFLAAPAARLRKLEQYRDWEQWIYNYKGESRSLAGLRVDRANRKVFLPEDVPAPVRAMVERELLAHPAPRTGVMAAYREHWLGRLAERYRGSPTRLIFLRLPRGPVPPVPRASNPEGTARRLARLPNVTLIDEHFFDSLERPELFMDPLHLNWPGVERFTLLLSGEVRRLLTAS